MVRCGRCRRSSWSRCSAVPRSSRSAASTPSWAASPVWSLTGPPASSPAAPRGKLLQSSIFSKAEGRTYFPPSLKRLKLKRKKPSRMMLRGVRRRAGSGGSGVPPLVLQCCRRRSRWTSRWSLSSAAGWEAARQARLGSPTTRPTCPIWRLSSLQQQPPSVVSDPSRSVNPVLIAESRTKMKFQITQQSVNPASTVGFCYKIDGRKVPCM